jgi:hypothetical protein
VGRIAALRARLGESLFPDAPRVTAGLRGWEAAALGAALVAIAAFMELLRPGLGVSLDSLWAEDGQIFLQGALLEGFWHTLGAPYGGYLVVVPRLIGEAATLLPIGDAAETFSILSALLIALSGLVVWFAAAGHIRSPYLRGALAGACVLSPVAGLEAVDSASYVSWYMLFATFWLLLWRPRTTWGAALGGLFVLATALSNPGVWFFLPVAALRALALRDRRDATLLAAYAAGGLAQVPVVLTHNGQTVEPEWTHDIWTVLVQRVVDGAALGLRLGGWAWAQLGWVLLIALLVLAAAGLVVGLRRASWGARRLVALALAIAAALFVVSVYQRAVGAQMLWPAGNYGGAGGRYAIVPALLVLSAGLVLLDQWLRGRTAGVQANSGRGLGRWVELAVVAGLALVVGVSFAVGDRAARRPGWEESLTSGRAQCRAENVPGVIVHISPPDFGLMVPCDELIGNEAPSAP